MRRSFAVVFLVSLSFSALTSCKPPFLGTTVNRDGNGQGPAVPPGQPQVLSFSPSSVVAGGPSFTLTINGLDFVPTTTAIWNDTTTLTTTYVSPTVLQAQVPASLIVGPGTADIIPSPLLTFNFGASFTITVPPLKGSSSFSTTFVPVAANDIAWDQENQQFYLSIASTNASNANSITALNPQSGVLGASVSTGTEPGRLSVSTDGGYIYAGLNNAASVRRYTLPALQADLDIPLGSNAFGPYYAIDLQAEPGSAHSVAISRGVNVGGSQQQFGVAVYDDAVARSQSVPGPAGGQTLIDLLDWSADAKHLYGTDTQYGTGLYIMAVSPAGIQLQLQTTTDRTYIGSHVQSASTTGYLYTDTGEVIDPAADAVVGNFYLNVLEGGYIAAAAVVDGQLNIAYFLLQTNSGVGQSKYVIEAFDLTHFSFLGAIPLPNISGTPSKMIRWGSNGLALLTVNASGTGGVGDGVYLVSGSFVTSPGN